MKQRNVNTGIITVVETVTIAGWLALVLAARPLLAIGVLFGGLTVEHVLRMALFGIPLTNRRVIDTLIFSAVETGLWAIWEAVLLPRFGPIVGNVLLGLGLTVEHTLTANVVLGRPLFVQLFDAGKINASAVEAVGAGLWRGSVAAGTPAGIASLIFAVFNFLEHRALIDAEERERGA